MAVKNAKPKEKDYKLHDGNGLFLMVKKTGYKSWRFKFTRDGKEGLVVFGAYPKMGLGDARRKAVEFRDELDKGPSPAVVKARAALNLRSGETQTFEQLARTWHEKEKGKWTPVHANDVITSMEKDLFPMLGPCPVDQIDSQLILAVLQEVEKRGAIETAHRLRQRAEAIFNYALAHKMVATNPTATLQTLLKPVPRGRRWPALLDIEALQDFVDVIDHAGASPVTRLASRFIGITAQRPGMVRMAEWDEFSGIDWTDPDSDISEAMWTVPANKMKQELQLRENEDYSHMVPLPPQAVEVLRRARLLNGRGRYVFSSATSSARPMSENALSFIYKREGYKGKHVPHGWRSSFSTVMNERTARESDLDIKKALDRHIIDLMLAHRASGVSATELIYNRAKYMDRRREIANDWANLLLEKAVDLDYILESPRRILR
jgi:hypothetical protein